MGAGRYLGFGSLRLQIQPESYLTDWANRYANQNWHLPINANEWINPSAIVHYDELKKALNAQYL